MTNEELLSTGDIQEVVTRNMHFVHYTVRQYQNTEYEYDDLVQVGAVGLMKAAKTFDISKGFKFISYAGICIRNELNMHLRQNKKHVPCASLDEAFNMNDGSDNLSLGDMIADTFDTYDEVSSICNTRVLLSLIEELPEREQQIVKHRYGVFNSNIWTQKELSTELGISQSYLSRLEVMVLDKLQKGMLREKICC